MLLQGNKVATGWHIKASKNRSWDKRGQSPRVEKHRINRHDLECQPQGQRGIELLLECPHGTDGLGLLGLRRKQKTRPSLVRKSERMGKTHLRKEVKKSWSKHKSEVDGICNEHIFGHWASKREKCGKYGL